MRRLPTALLAAATVFVPVLSVVGHGAAGLGSAGRGHEVLVTGHDRPDPAPHLEPLSGTLELYCLGCLLDPRQPAQTAGVGSVARPRTEDAPARTETLGRRALELPAYRSPRAPPIA